MDDLLTIKEVAQTLQLHPQTVKEYILVGKLPAVKIGHRTTRIASKDLEAFIASRKGDNYFNDHDSKK